MLDSVKNQSLLLPPHSIFSYSQWCRLCPREAGEYCLSLCSSGKRMMGLGYVFGNHGSTARETGISQ